MGVYGKKRLGGEVKALSETGGVKGGKLWKNFFLQGGPQNRVLIEGGGQMVPLRGERGGG